MRKIIVLVFVFVSGCLLAQKETIPATESFSIEGKEKKGFVVSLEDLSSYKSHSTDSIVITNHLGEKRSTLKSEGSFVKRYFG